MPELDSILATYLNRPGVPRFGAVAGIWRNGTLVDSAARGSASAYRIADDGPELLPEGERSAVTIDTRFDVASLTKLFTAVLAMALVEEGLLSLDTPVGDALPEFSDGERRRVTLRHLLTHTAGLREDSPLWRVPADERLSTVLRLPLEGEAGGGFRYSCLGYVAAGAMLERVAATSLCELISSRVIDPLGLSATGFGPADAVQAAATEYQPWTGRGIVRGEVHDEVSWSLGGVAGNAGLFSTLADLGRFGEMIRTGGAIDGCRILSEQTVARMLRPHLRADGDPGFDQGIGFRIDAPGFMGSLAGAGAAGHTGFTGTSLVIDLKRALTVVLLTNRVHPTRSGTDVSALRRAVADAAFETSE